MRGGIKFCPRCNERYNFARGVTDFVHNCHSGDPTLDNEDVVVLGDWVDYTGSETVQPLQTQTAGTQNTEMWDDAGIRGAFVPEFTNRGKSTNTHRVRKHLEFIHIKKGECKDGRI